jgi:gamma-glutamyltranspeptidase/glutathione hydrolase
VTIVFAPTVALTAVLPILFTAEPHASAATKAMIATVHPIATDVAVDAIRAGGNAVDAAVAAALTLGVVDGHNSGIGGGCFILMRLADGRFVAIDGRETAPAGASRDMYIIDGEPQRTLSKLGPLASGVPGALAAYDRAAREYGRLPLAFPLLRGAAIAETGFPLDRPYADKLEREANELSRFPGTRAALLKPDGAPYEEGETLCQPDLAATYRAIARHGIDWFYGGPLAGKISKWMQEHGGLLTREDFAGYRARLREPVVTRYRGYTIIGFPPPSSGGVHVAQILNTLERFDLNELYTTQRAGFYHLLGESMKLSFADRAYWLGDPAFAPVPRGLVDKSYAAELAKRIQFDRPAEVPNHGQPPRWETDHFDRHTTHIAAADSHGNWVAITATVNTTFGSKVIVPGTGVVLNNQMDDFSIAPGVPNAFGLIGADANAIAPGKRPLSSMSPTIVLKNGQPVLTLGAAGGPKIITQVVMAAIYHLDLGLPLPRALAAPRVHHQWRPDQLLVDTSLDPGVVKELERLGHHVRRTSSIAVVQAIGVTNDGEAFIGVHDPRVPGKAAGID